jgi:hypothetical protein
LEDEYKRKQSGKKNNLSQIELQNMKNELHRMLRTSVVMKGTNTSYPTSNVDRNLPKLMINENGIVFDYRLANKTNHTFCKDPNSVILGKEKSAAHKDILKKK